MMEIFRHRSHRPFSGGRSGGARAALLLAAAGWFAMVCGAHAQGGRESDGVLFPQPEPRDLFVGPEAGYGWWENKGGFGVSDGPLSCTQFADGEGRGITLGAKAFIYLNSWFFVSPRARYEARSGSFKTALPGDPVRDASNAIVTLQEEAQVDATFAAATLDVTIGIEFFRTGIYLFGGGSGSLLLDGFYDYTERVTGPAGFTYSDTESDEHELISGRSFATYEKNALDLRGGLGYIFRAGPLGFNPEVFYSSPLTSVLGAPDEMKQTGIIATFSVMYNFGL